MRNRLLCLVIVMMVFAIAGCGEDAVYTSPNVSQEIREVPIHYHPVHPNFGSDRSLYAGVDGY